MTEPQRKLLSYAILIELHATRLAEANKAKPTIDNACHVIREWMAHFDCVLETIVGRELYDFERHLARFLEAKLEAGVAKSSLTPVKSRLVQMNETFERWRYANDLPWQFWSALTELVKRKGVTWKALASEALGDKTKARKVMNWAQNVNLPRKDSLDEIRKIEHYLDVPEGTLTARLPKRIFGTKSDRVGQWTKSAWGEKQAALVRSGEKFRYSEWTAEQEEELADLVKSKSTRRYLADDGIRYENEDLWRADPDGAYPTAVKFKSTASHFYGYLINLAPPHFRVEPDQLSLALFTDFSRVESWIEFARQRAGNIYNGFAQTQLNTVRMLTRPDSGYLWANARYADKYPGALGNNPWRQHCEDCWKEAKGLHKDIGLDRGYKKTRIARDVLSPLLNDDHPIQMLYTMIDEHQKEKPMPHQADRKAATWYRDLLLMYFMIACPLRMKSLAQLTYKKGGSGTVQRQKDGRWHVNLPPTAFKNQQGAAKDGYRTSLPPDMWPLLDIYVDKHRPVLLETYQDDLEGVEHDLFLNNALYNVYQEHGVPRTLARKAKSLSDHIRYLFKLYLGISAGGHAYRHVIATDWLKNHPDSYMIVAHILHDKIETVIKEYAHLKSENAMRTYHDYLATLR